MPRRKKSPKREAVVQKTDMKPVSRKASEKDKTKEDHSPLILVLEKEDAEKTLTSLIKAMQDRLSTISELRSQLEKLVETLLDEFANVQALYQRVIALEKGISGDAANRSRKKPDAATTEMVEIGGILLEGGKKDRIKQEIEYLQTIKHLLKSMNNLSDILAVASSPRQPGAMASPVNGKKKILIVEDDPISRKLLNHFLEKENYTVLMAASAEEGFQSIGREKPDLILLDIMLPGVDGFQFLSRLKEDKDIPAPPVFIISSLAQESGIVKALQAGAMDYILKPFSPQVILAKINQLFRSSR
jgi:CheY-like chemotaxis protein